MDVTDILRDRMQSPAGLQRMVSASIAVHVLLAAAIILAPGGLLTHRADEQRPVMTISLSGGGDGPTNGGMTTMGGRPVQAVADDAAKRAAITPPAAKTPEMTEPLPNAKPSKAIKTPAPVVKEAPDQARGRTPTKGAQPSPGSTVSDTGVRGQGFGLSTGGGPGTGSTLDVQDFCCPGYIALMVERIRSAWQRNQGTPGETIVKFTIQRDGSLTNTAVERGSGTFTLDAAAQRAVLQTRTLPPLPAEFPNPTLTVHLSFQYQ
ncbi:MAG TPA: TonB family protein [Vicinamibacterales bacterium]